MLRFGKWRHSSSQLGFGFLHQACCIWHPPNELGSCVGTGVWGCVVALQPVAGVWALFLSFFRNVCMLIFHHSFLLLVCLCVRFSSFLPSFLPSFHLSVRSLFLHFFVSCLLSWCVSLFLSFFLSFVRSGLLSFFLSFFLSCVCVSGSSFLFLFLSVFILFISIVRSSPVSFVRFVPPLLTGFHCCFVNDYVNDVNVRVRATVLVVLKHKNQYEN